jgi:hypothetical protein
MRIDVKRGLQYGRGAPFLLKKQNCDRKRYHVQNTACYCTVLLETSPPKLHNQVSLVGIRIRVRCPQDPPRVVVIITERVKTLVAAVLTVEALLKWVHPRVDLQRAVAVAVGSP